MHGIDPLDAGYIATSDMMFDFAPKSQDIDNANAHSMARPEQSKYCAQQGALKFINGQLMTGTLMGLGAAMHTNEDSFAAGHAYTEWDGNLTWAHVVGDWFPSYSEVVNAVSTDLNVIDVYQNGGTYY